MRICGPKCSLCGLIISAWGVVQLVLMGIFYHVRSVALAEDLPISSEQENNATEFYAAVDRGYTQVCALNTMEFSLKLIRQILNYYKNAINCWIAACLYILTFLLSGHQFYVNSRSSLTM